MMNISIIIPHKNSTALLKRLLDSISEISVTEIIVVDDRSNDEEKEVLRRLSTEYSFALYDNEGKYAGGARNTGLKYASKDWVLFADSDDYFLSGVGGLLSKYTLSSFDIIFFNVISRYSENNQPAYRAKHINHLFRKTIKEANTDYLRYCYTVPWGKLIRRQLIVENNLYFDEVIAGNDMMFSVLTGHYAKKVDYCNESLYCVTVAWNSITTTLTWEKFDSRFNVTLKVNNLLREWDKGKYQISVLYFLGKSYQFGLKYSLSVIKRCIQNRSNIFIGLGKILNIKEVIQDRQNISGSKK